LSKHVITEHIDMSTPWLIRIPEVFHLWEADILRDLNAQVLRKLGKDYYLIRMGDSVEITDGVATKFLSWKQPVHHSWPCRKGGAGAVAKVWCGKPSSCVDQCV
jgi:hypothetical protein